MYWVQQLKHQYSHRLFKILNMASRKASLPNIELDQYKGKAWTLNYTWHFHVIIWDWVIKYNDTVVFLRDPDLFLRNPKIEYGAHVNIYSFPIVPSEEIQDFQVSLAWSLWRGWICNFIKRKPLAIRNSPWGVVSILYNPFLISKYKHSVGLPNPLFPHVA